MLFLENNLLKAGYKGRLVLHKNNRRNMYLIKLPDNMVAVLRGLKKYHGNRTVAGQVQTAVSRYLRQEEKRFWRSMQEFPDERTGFAESKGSNPVSRSTLSNNVKGPPRQAQHQVHNTIKSEIGKLNKIMPINNEQSRPQINKLQINQSVDSDSNGNILRRSLMINIRCDDVDEAYTLYQQLKTKLNSKESDRKGGDNRHTDNSQYSNTPICQCGRTMVLRQGRTGMFFHGCSGYPKCRLTRDFHGPDEVDVDEIRIENIQV